MIDRPCVACVPYERLRTTGQACPSFVNKVQARIPYRDSGIDKPSLLKPTETMCGLGDAPSAMPERPRSSCSTEPIFRGNRGRLPRGENARKKNQNNVKLEHCGSAAPKELRPAISTCEMRWGSESIQCLSFFFLSFPGDNHQVSLLGRLVLVRPCSGHVERMARSCLRKAAAACPGVA